MNDIARLNGQENDDVPSVRRIGMEMGMGMGINMGMRVRILNVRNFSDHAL